MSVAAKVRGANTRAEIFSQPQCWKACFQALEKSQQIKKLATKFRLDSRVPVHRLWFQLLHLASRGGQLATDNRKAGARHPGFRIAPLPGPGSECPPPVPAHSGFAVGEFFGGGAGG